MSVGRGNGQIFADISKLESVMIYKHYFTYDQIQRMSYFDFTFYSKLITNIQKQVQDAIEEAQNAT